MSEGKFTIEAISRRLGRPECRRRRCPGLVHEDLCHHHPDDFINVPVMFKTQALSSYFFP